MNKRTQVFSRRFHNQLRLLSFHYGLAFSLGDPNVSQIEVTNACNYRCEMCPRKSMTRSIEYMDFNLYTKIIGSLHSSNGVIYLHFLGEPLMHPKLDKFIAYGKSKGYEMGFFTNGGLLTKEKSNQIIDVELDYLVISFDVNENTFNKLRTGGDFDKVQKNIINFLALRNLKNKQRPVVTISSITLNKSKDKEIAKFWNDKVDFFDYKEIHNWIGDTPEITQIAGWKKRTRKICLLPFTSVCVLVDGRVVPCCLDYDGKYVLGDLKRDSLKSVWNGEKIATLRRALLEGRKQEIELCSKCSYGPAVKGTVRNKSYILHITKRLTNRLMYPQS